jgi:hypothetical protein
MGRRPKRRGDAASEIVSIRLTKAERAKLEHQLALAEKASGLAAGTLSPSAFMRSIVLKHIAASG